MKFVDQWAAENGEWPHCQACGEPISGDETVCDGSDGCRCERCTYLLVDEADTFAIEHCRILDPLACLRTNDDERFSGTNFEQLIDQLDDGTVRGSIYCCAIENCFRTKLIPALEESLAMEMKTASPWRGEGF